MVSQAQAAAARGRVESQMTDTCTVTGDPTMSVWDEATSSYTATPTTLYEGVCKVSEVGYQTSMSQRAGKLVVASQLVLKLPVEKSAGVVPGAMVAVTASRFDPVLVGRTFRVKEPHHQTFATQRRFPLEEVVDG